MIDVIISKISSTRSAQLLIISNIFPIFGVLFLNYDILNIILLYWAESGIIGFINVLKILYGRPTSLSQNQSSKILFIIQKLISALFFSFHFGFFMCLHVFFILGFFSQELLHVAIHIDALLIVIPFLKKVWLALLFLLFSHIYSFYENYIKKEEYKSLTMKSSMSQPYVRIVVMQITIIFGGFIYLFSGEKIGAIFLLILLKIIVDLISHLKEREYFQKVLSF